MNQQLFATRREATRALTLMMGAIALGWVLFIAGQYVALVTSEGFGSYYDEPQRITYSQFFTIAAIAVTGLGATFAKRRLAVTKATHTNHSRLVDSVSTFAGTIIIISMALAVWAVFFTFMNGFYSGQSEVMPGARVINLYLPIVCYTVLLVALILAGFVFNPAAGDSVPASDEASSAAEPQPQEAAPAAVANPATAEQAGAPKQQTRAVAFAYATPIIAGAVALLLGLFVYDFTRTALQIWIWVVIFAILGAGIVIGIKLAMKGIQPGTRLAPVANGANTLGFILAIIFSVIVTSMSLGYGVSAVYALNVSPSVSMYAYGENEKYTETSDPTVSIENPVVSVWGSDLQRGSEVVVTLKPTGEQVLSTVVDRDQWAGKDADLPATLAAGDYELVLTAKASDGVEVELVLSLTVKDDGFVEFPNGTSSDFDQANSRLLPVSAGWVLRELLPAGLLLALGIAVIAVTLTTRNRDGDRQVAA